MPGPNDFNKDFTAMKSDNSRKEKGSLQDYELASATLKILQVGINHKGLQS